MATEKEEKKCVTCGSNGSESQLYSDIRTLGVYYCKEHFPRCNHRYVQIILSEDYPDGACLCCECSEQIDWYQLNTDADYHIKVSTQPGNDESQCRHRFVSPKLVADGVASVSEFVCDSCNEVLTAEELGLDVTVTKNYAKEDVEKCYRCDECLKPMDMWHSDNIGVFCHKCWRKQEVASQPKGSGLHEPMFSSTTDHTCDGGCPQCAGVTNTDPKQTATTPGSAQWRKQRPLWSGVLNYFPDALLEVAHCSWVGNEQHNPGQPLHWDRSKSGDELDACARHLSQAGTMDTDNVRHSAKVAWRALANLQKEIQKENNDE